MPDLIFSEPVNNDNSENTESDAAEPEIFRASPDILPRDTVHCYPARKSIITGRRITTVFLGAVLLSASVFFLLPESRSITLMAFTSAGFIICLVVFLQSFLIAKYRVALDYVNKEVVLRYQFQKICIPFEDFDTRAGKPDEAQMQLSRMFLRATKVAPKYLILDNVRESACYQTSSKDLASPEDFDQLKAEAENIRDVYRGKPEPEPEPVKEEDEMTRIINSALSDKPKNIDEQGK